MELKLDENGNAVLVEGKPVYVHKDGQEIPLDAPGVIKKIQNLTEEKQRHYENFQKASERLKLYGEMEPEEVHAKLKTLEDLDVEAARKALETVANLEDGDLVKAGQVEKLKAEMHKAFTERENEITKSWEKKLAEIGSALNNKNETIYELMVNSKFASSPTIIDKTILPPDIAANYFAKNFKVEGEGANATVVGYINHERIFSKERPGEIAEFEEALGAIIDHYPMKERIMRTSGSGAGTSGNTSTTVNSNREMLANMNPTERLKYLHRTQQAEKH